MARLAGDGLEAGTAWSCAAYAQSLNLAETFGFGLRDQKSLCGFVLARHLPDEAEVLMLMVAPECRRQGLASRLMHAAIDHALAHGAQRMLLEVAETNQAARAFYAAQAWQEIGRRPNYYGAGHGLVTTGRVDAVLLAWDSAGRSGAQGVPCSSSSNERVR